MSGFIEDFYYGNADPQMITKQQRQSIRKYLQTLSDIEIVLTDTLTGAEKKQFLEYANAWSELNGETALENFITGFRMGAMFTMDTFFSAPENQK